MSRRLILRQAQDERVNKPPELATIVRVEELTILPQNSARTVSILGGTGQQGRGLARRFAHAGVPVVVGSRDPERARETVAAWPTSAAATPIRVADNASAVAAADVTILAVPFATVDLLLQDIGPHFRAGSLAIDLTVPVTFVDGKMAMLDVAEGSAAEHVRARLPATVRLACAFKTLPAHLLGAGGESLDCDEFVCGDSDEARSEALALAARLPGLRAIDVGPLSRARSIEHLTALAIAINRRHKIHDARFRVIGL
jgi:8-hydroxy-5-deazaflavin:NADPH oxidoreductase